MKNIMKNLTMFGLIIGMLLFAPVIVSHAAEGTISFSDPTGKVGEEITVKVKMEAGGAAIGDGQATISYDTGKLEFVSGTNATAGTGTVELFASGTGTETELNFELKFKALSEGDTTIEVTNSTAYLYSDETLNLTPGSASVKIEAGDGTSQSTGESGERQTSEANIELAGSMYGIYENFTEALIPSGFTKTTISYNGEEHNAILQDSSGKKMVYLITGSNDPVMAVYDEADNSFVIAEQVSLGEELYIFILGEGDDTKLPEQYQEAIMEINGTEFPAWQNIEAKDYYLVYALSSTGTEGYYQYDSVEGTYQRYVPEKTEDTEEKSEGSGVLAAVRNVVDQYLLIIAAVIAAVLLIMLMIIIVISVKLRHRNTELEEYYDDYDDEYEMESKSANGKSGQQFAGFKKHEYDDLDDEFLENDELYDDEYEDEYDDEYDDESYDAEYEDEYDEKMYDDEETYQYEEDEYEDEYDEYEENDRDADERYNVDFIDI